MGCWDCNWGASSLFYFKGSVFIISVCNKQLLNWIENEMIWILSFVPGFSSALLNLIAKLNSVKENYLTRSAPVSSDVKCKKWDFSFASLWNTVVWLMLPNFSVKIVNATLLHRGI